MCLLSPMTGALSWLCCCPCLLDQVPAGTPPDVWMQLLEQCAEDKAAQPAVMQFMLRQLKRQQQQVATATTAAAAAEAQATVATAASTAAAAEAGAATAEAAELRERVQALEGQLQQVLSSLKSA